MIFMVNTKVLSHSSHNPKPLQAADTACRVPTGALFNQHLFAVDDVYSFAWGFNFSAL